MACWLIFFDVKALAKQVVEVLRAPEAVAQLGQRARQTVINRYDLQTQCLPQLMALLALRTSGGAAQRLR